MFCGRVEKFLQKNREKSQTVFFSGFCFLRASFLIFQKKLVGVKNQLNTRRSHTKKSEKIQNIFFGRSLARGIHYNGTKNGYVYGTMYICTYLALVLLPPIHPPRRSLGFFLSAPWAAHPSRTTPSSRAARGQLPLHPLCTQAA
jgi:hypothetical protein